MSKRQRIISESDESDEDQLRESESPGTESEDSEPKDPTVQKSSQLKQRKSPNPMKPKRTKKISTRLKDFAHGKEYPETTDSSGNNHQVPKIMASLSSGLATIAESMKTFTAKHSIDDVFTSGNIDDCSRLASSNGSGSFIENRDKGEKQGNKVTITSDVPVKGLLLRGSDGGNGRGRGFGRGRGRGLKMLANCGMVGNVTSKVDALRYGEPNAVGSIGLSESSRYQFKPIDSSYRGTTGTTVATVHRIDDTSDADGIFDFPDDVCDRDDHQKDLSKNTSHDAELDSNKFSPEAPVRVSQRADDVSCGRISIASTPLQKNVNDLRPRKLDDDLGDERNDTTDTRLLHEIRKELRNTNKRLGALEAAVAAIGSRFDRVFASDFPAKPLCLPLKTKEDVVLFEEISDADFNQTVDFLGALSSGTITDRANLILKASMEDSLANAYSMQGTKSKPKILGTRFCSALYAAVSKNILPEQRPTHDVFVRAMTAALKSAKERFRRLPVPN